ncbi:hypothetical protein SRABI96_03479 [Peribacillus sp. Bi96]|nr:hypothetical protein SRABI96_03479 [Peribacillus sp. Bi96]
MEELLVESRNLKILAKDCSARKNHMSGLLMGFPFPFKQEKHWD